MLRMSGAVPPLPPICLRETYKVKFIVMVVGESEGKFKCKGKGKGKGKGHPRTGHEGPEGE